VLTHQTTTGTSGPADLEETEFDTIPTVFSNLTSRF
jgi:hypothetical protein